MFLEASLGALWRDKAGLPMVDEKLEHFVEDAKMHLNAVSERYAMIMLRYLKKALSQKK